MAIETTHNVIASEVMIGDIEVDPNFLVNFIQNLLIDGNGITIASVNSPLWKSVYWNPDWAKPDRMTQFIQKINDNFTRNAENTVSAVGFKWKKLGQF